MSASKCKKCSIKGAGQFVNASLLQATRRGHYDCMKHALEAGANVNAVDSRSTSGKSSRNTALTIAAKHGFRKCVKLLLKKGADVNKSNSYGTALIIAAGRGHDKCVEVLLKKGGGQCEFIWW